jgi:biopolymer transport protein ExbD
MTRRFLLMLCLLLPFAVTAPLSAHDPLRFDGTVVKMEKSVLTIQTRDNNKDVTLDITFNAKTKVTQDGKAVPRSALKAGVHVIVDAEGCIDDPKIDGVAVQIVPAHQ